jgi:hypothetical protein
MHVGLKYRKFVPGGFLNSGQKITNKRVLRFPPSSCNRYEREGEGLVERIVTGDETWVHHFEPESKQQSSGNTLSFPPTERSKMFLLEKKKKVMLILFRDINGPILEHYTEHGQTVNSERYSAMLKDKLKPVIRTKRTGLL